MRRRSTVFLALSLLCLAYTTLPARAENENGSARAVVEQFHASLLSVMKDAKALGVKGRYDRLAPEIEHAFHLPLMIRVATGSFWGKATEAQRQQLIKAFTRFSVGTYAVQFNGYSGEVFKTVGERPGPQNTVLVHTRIVDHDKPVDLTYVTKRIKNQWRIIDVLLANDVSELAVRRSEYRQLLKKGGIDGLIVALNDKADALVATN